MPPVLAAACVLGLLAGLQPTDARAASQRARHIRPSGICEAPLPVYDAYLRKSPQAVTNTGDETVFVNCAMPADPVGDLGSAWVEVRIQSTVAANTSVTCTLVTGNADAPVYDAFSRPLAPYGNNWFTWAGLDKLSIDGLFAVMCALPPGVQLTGLYAKESDSAGGI